MYIYQYNLFRSNASLVHSQICSSEAGEDKRIDIRKPTTTMLCCERRGLRGNYDNTLTVTKLWEIGSVFF